MTKTFKITKITLGAIVFSICLALLTDLFFEKFVIYENDYSNAGKIHRLINNEYENEIPIFGSSLARNNYFPDSLEYQVFNYGMKGAIFEVVEPLLKIEFEKEKTTPIIYNFHHLTFFSHPSTSIQLSNFVPFIENQHIKELLIENGYFKEYLKFPGLRYYGCYTDYIKEYLRPYLDKQETISKGGVHTNAPNKRVFDQHVMKRNIMIADRLALTSKKTNTPTLFTEQDSIQLYRLESMLLFKPEQHEVVRFEKMLADHPGRKLILVYTPQHRSKLAGVENLSELEVFFKGLKNRHSNIEILNYSNVNYPDEYYKDTGHLSLAGAKHFSGQLNLDLNKILKKP